MRGNYKVRLTKLSKNRNALRTKQVTGNCDFLPEVGFSFTMWAKPINKESSYRIIETSKVQEFTKNKPWVCIFNTLNSRYKVEVL